MIHVIRKVELFVVPILNEIVKVLVAIVPHEQMLNQYIGIFSSICPSIAGT